MGTESTDSASARDGVLTCWRATCRRMNPQTWLIMQVAKHLIAYDPGTNPASQLTIEIQVDFIEFPTIRQWTIAGFQIWINNGTFNPGLDDCIFDGNVDDAVFYPGGDANLDVVFDSTDLIEVMAAGLYETGRLAEWASGDWNGDRRFDSGDLVRAFAEGRYSSGAQTSPAAANRIVPGPAMLPWLALVGIACGLRRRKGVQSKSKLIHAR